MKGQKYKTVVVHPFDMPEYRANCTFVNRTAIRDEIRQGQCAKRGLKMVISRIELLEGVVKKYERLADKTDTLYMRDYYNWHANEWFQKLMQEVRYKLKTEADLLKHGHEANRLEHPTYPTPTHDEWIRANDTARLTRRPYRRQARVNQRVSAFGYEYEAEHDVVDQSQLKWARLVVIMATYLHFH